MSDANTRELARRGHQGDPEEAARAWRAGLRAEGLPSDLTPERVLLGAFLGDSRCRRAAGISFAELDEFPRGAWLSALERLAGGVLTGRRVGCPNKACETGDCESCNGTGRVPETLRTRLLVRVAVACQRRALRGWGARAAQRARGLDAWDAWAVDPGTHAQPERDEEWARLVGETVEDSARGAIRSAAREVGVAEVDLPVEAARGLAPWVLGEGA